MAYLLGVDGGTESIRAIVFDLDGRPKGSHASAYQTQFPNPGWAEQNPDDWWRAMGQATRGALAAGGIAPDQVIAMASTPPAAPSSRSMRRASRCAQP